MAAPSPSDSPLRRKAHRAGYRQNQFGPVLPATWSKWPNIWYHGDWAIIDENGFWFLHGRSDDTIKIAGRRTGPAEIESALMENPSVSEAATIGVPDELKGEDIVCFVVLNTGYKPNESLRTQLKAQVIDIMGKRLNHVISSL